MPKASPIQESFNGGEFSPLLYGRVNTERYKTGLATCLNYIATIQGPLIRRPGTVFVAPTKNGGASAPILVRFEFSTTQAYILEFGNLYMRVYRDNAAVVESALVIGNITQANPGVVTYAGTDPANGDEVEIASVGGMTQVNGRRFTVANVNTVGNTFELQGIDTTGYDAYTIGGTASRVYTIATPYTTADLFQLKFAQSADVLYIAHPNYAPRKLSRTGHTSWTLSNISFRDGPYLPTNSTATTLALSGTSGSVTVTASSVNGINDNAGFKATDVGRLIRWKDAANNWTWLAITAFTDTTHVTATIFGPNASAGTATVNWRLGVWSTTTGFPAAVTFHEDRLVYGGPTSYPQRIDGSNTGDYENFAPSNAAGTVGDANAIAFTLNATDVNVIRWMRSDEKGLLCGTVGAEWIVRPSQQGEALTPTNVTAKPSTRHGSANVEPVQAGKATIFVQRALRKVRELTYLFEVDGFRAPDLTLLGEHVTFSGIKQMAYQQEPQSIIWAVRNDGVLIGLTYERDLDALRVGWHRHILGGGSDSNGGAALVESVAVIPSSDGTRDEVWLVVKRYINGQTVRYVEYVTKFFDDEDAQEDAFFVDCGLTYNGAPSNDVTGLWHLEGETVSVWADGASHPDVVVTNGTATFNREASVAHVGYGYVSDGQTLRIEAGAADGTAQGKAKRAHRVGFMVHRMLGFKFGRDFDNLNEHIFRTAGDLMGVQVPMFSGVFTETFDADYDLNGQVCWRQDQPGPGTILAVMPQIVTQDRG